MTTKQHTQMDDFKRAYRAALTETRKTESEAFARDRAAAIATALVISNVEPRDSTAARAAKRAVNSRLAKETVVMTTVDVTQS